MKKSKILVTLIDDYVNSQEENNLLFHNNEIKNSGARRKHTDSVSVMVKMVMVIFTTIIMIKVIKNISNENIK